MKGITMNKKLFGLIFILVLTGCSNQPNNSSQHSKAQLDQHIIYQNNAGTFNRREDTVYLLNQPTKITGYQIVSQYNQFTLIFDTPYDYNHTTIGVPNDNYTDISISQNKQELISDGVNNTQSKINDIDYSTRSSSYKILDSSAPIKLKITEGKTKKILFETTYYLI
ncbi:hypothetical protein [Holzapfeliella floricola]|uniref:Lipoprotein n=1 Tax=Holzapfeliella floricola DSM 23037 = JCM 16512 TaxID=1423744 RepID=A0A0R2DMY0_9LACO|nr:hypothetical protein [Holzapfeliella floricola]KRN04819.1 hypothetical protein FC86_GL001176 [Holzapfeliella floricola DSM 23037 = JCM 16512]